MRTGWQEIALVVNSDGNGCVKDWKQWAKYWKDKKATVKRKANMIEAARQRTGGGIEAEVVELTELEQRIVALAGGLSFATGDRHLLINPFPETEDTGSQLGGSNQSESILLQEIPGPSENYSQAMVNYDIPVEWNNTAAALIGEGSEREVLESPPAAQRNSPDAVVEGVNPVQGEDETVSLDEETVTEQSTDRVSPSARADALRDEGSARRRILVETPSQRRRRSLPSQRASGGSMQRRRAARARGGASAARRRLLRRSPPSQRRSKMASLTERFIAIEERRVDAELAVARSQDTFSQGYRMMAEALNNFANTVGNLAQQIIEAYQQSVVRR